MIVVSRTYFMQLICDMDAIRHEPGRLLDQARFGSNATGPRRHSKFAHVGHHLPNIAVPFQPQDALKIPTACHPWMFMEEEPPLASLVLVWQCRI